MWEAAAGPVSAFLLRAAVACLGVCKGSYWAAWSLTLNYPTGMRRGLLVNAAKALGL